MGHATMQASPKDLLEAACTRLRDKKLSVRREAAQHLMDLYRWEGRLLCMGLLGHVWRMQGASCSAVSETSSWDAERPFEGHMCAHPCAAVGWQAMLCWQPVSLLTSPITTKPCASLFHDGHV